MLVKIFGRGKGGGQGVIGYLLGKNYINDNSQIRQGATLLQGDAYLTNELINATPYAQRYTAGALSFTESPDEITDEQKRNIMQAFENTIFAGLDGEQFNILWVEHTDKINPETKKPRLELNFVIPNLEMNTGKRLQPYYHKADLLRVNAFQNLINYSYGLTDPHDPNRQRLINPYASRNLPKTTDLIERDTPKFHQFKTHTDAKQQINNLVLHEVEQGNLKNQDDIVKFLPSLNVVIKRVTENSVTVSAENIKKNIRLDSNIFKKGWLEQNNDLSKERLETPTATRIEQSMSIWRDEMEKKYFYHVERFKPNDKTPLKADIDSDLKQMQSITATATAPAEPPKQKTPLTRLVKDLFPITATFKRDFYKKDNIQTVENLITQGNDVYLNYFKDGDFRPYHRPQSTIEQNIYNQLKRHVDKQTQRLNTDADIVRDYLTMNISEYAERHKIALNDDDMSRITKIHNDLLYKEIMEKPQVESESNQNRPEPTAPSNRF
ncbi:relaxase/mobilization nuclease domain-containing protein [Proteus mirabilis]|uniref:relaxase/mobilization nuclease domain-containing protein n=1 Tax=Proteus mirabilis TaxID=584 RepID=UPI0034D609F5